MRGFGATIAIALALSASVSVASAAPSPWNSLVESQGTFTDNSNLTEIGLERTANGDLHVAWVHDRGDGTSVLVHSVFSGTLPGKAPVVHVTSNVIASATESANQSFNPSVDLVANPGTGLRVFFSQLAPGSPIDRIMATSTAPVEDTPTWSAPAAASATPPAQRSPVYAASGIGAGLGLDGVPVMTWGDSSPDGGGFHVGLAGGPDGEFSPSCCEIDPNVAVDSVTGEPWVAAHLLDTGIGVVSLDSGQTVSVGKSVAAWTQQRTSISGRIGAPDVYVAYGSGTNMFDARPAIHQVNGPNDRALKGFQNAEHVGLAPAPDGRMWVYWSSGNHVFAVRSNPAVTKFGEVVSLKTFKGSDTVWHLIGDGSLGFLDLLAHTQQQSKAGVDYTLYSVARLLPGLTLKISPAKVNAGDKVEVTVEDAGDPVAGATVKVKLGGKTVSAKTGADGTASLGIPKSTDPGNYELSAQEGGYSPAERNLKVK